MKTQQAESYTFIQPKHEAFRQLVPIDFHGNYDSKDLYGSRLEHFTRPEITNVLVRTEFFICSQGILESNSHWPWREVEH